MRSSVAGPYESAVTGLAPSMADSNEVGCPSRNVCHSNSQGPPCCACDSAVLISHCHLCSVAMFHCWCMQQHIPSTIPSMSTFLIP
jgi:hypothetical protein